MRGDPPGTLHIRWDQSGSGSIRCTLRRPLGSTDRWCESTTDLTVTVMEYPDPVIFADGPLEFCEGDSILLRTIGGMRSYRWIMDGDTVSTAEAITTREGGEYRVLVTNAGGCDGISDPVHITVHPAPDIAIRGPRVVCAGSRVTYTAVTGSVVAYNWTVGNGIAEPPSDTDSISVTWAEIGGGYVRLVVDNGFCRALDSLAVTVLDSLSPVIVPAGPHLLCEGDSIQLESDPVYTYYRWDTPAGARYTRSITASAGGIYRLYAESGDGCSGTSDPVEILVHIPDPPRITGPTDLCIGDTAILSASTGYRSYLWSTGSNERVITVCQSGQYQVSVTDLSLIHI